MASAPAPARYAMAVALGVPVVGFIVMARILRKDEAIDAATFLALREGFGRGPK